MQDAALTEQDDKEVFQDKVFGPTDDSLSLSLSKTDLCRGRWSTYLKAGRRNPRRLVTLRFGGSAVELGDKAAGKRPFKAFRYRDVPAERAVCRVQRKSSTNSGPHVTRRQRRWITGLASGTWPKKVATDR